MKVPFKSFYYHGNVELCELVQYMQQISAQYKQNTSSVQQHTSPVHITHQPSAYSTPYQHIHVHCTTSPEYTIHQPSTTHVLYIHHKSECRCIAIDGCIDDRQPADSADLSFRIMIRKTGIPKAKLLHGMSSTQKIQLESPISCSYQQTL